MAYLLKVFFLFQWFRTPGKTGARRVRIRISRRDRDPQGNVIYVFIKCRTML
jgi:hypothetical protein